MSNEFKLVPVEATEAMTLAACDSYFDSDSSAWTAMAGAYRAMLAAAPQPPALGGGANVHWWAVAHAQVELIKRLKDENDSLKGSCKSMGKDMAKVARERNYARAQAGRFKAEIEILSYDCKVSASVISAQKEEIDKLKAETERHKANAEEWEKASLHWMAERDQLEARCDEMEALLLLIRDQPALNPIHRARIKTIMSKPAGGVKV